MFYAHFVLSKKGPLSRIWLAAHWDKKLTRAQVFETNISSSVEAILEPKMKMALRTSGHLLLGVVKIFSKKTKYLFTDCSEAFVKIKMAFRPGMVDLQEGGNREAAITLPEPMMDFETTFAEMSEVNMGSYGINQSRPEDITLREDFGDIQLGRQDDDFGESAFDETGREIMRDSDNTFGYTRPSERMSIRDDFGVDDSNPFDNIGSINDKKSMHISGINSVSDNRDLDDDDNFGGDFLPHDDASNDSFGEEMILPHGDLFGDPSAQEQLDHIANEIELHMDKSKWDLEKRGGLDDSLASVMFPPTPGPSAMAEINAALGIEQSAVEHGQQNNDTEALQAMDSKMDQEKIPTLKISISNTPGFSTAEAIKSSTPAVMNNKNMLPPGSKNPDDSQQVTLISNDSTAFALGPIEASTIIGLESKRGKRKRRLVIDDQKTIPSEVMKIQMQDTSDITSQLDLAPPTKKLMLWKETGSVDKLFALPGRFLPCRLLQRLFFRNLITQQNPEDNGEEIFKPRTSLTSAQQQMGDKLHDLPGLNSSKMEMKDLQEEIHARHKQPLDIINETGEEMNCSSSIKSSEKLSIHGQSNNPYLSSAMCSINSNLISTPHANLMDDNVHPMNTPSINLFSDALEDHRLDTGLGAGPHGKPPCSDYEPDNDMGMVDDDDYDTDLPFAPQRSIYMGSTPMIHGLDNSEFVNLEQELAACDQEADAQVIETLKNASELTAHVQATAGDKVESLEEKRLEKRSKVMLKMLKSRHDQGLDSPFSFQSMCAKNAKKQVASKFYTILLLRKQGSIHLSQETPFSEIMISQGENFLASVEV